MQKQKQQSSAPPTNGHGTPPSGFTINVAYDPARPGQVNYSVLPNSAGNVRDGDVVEALQLARDDILIRLAGNMAIQQYLAEQAQTETKKTAEAV